MLTVDVEWVLTVRRVADVRTAQIELCGESDGAGGDCEEGERKRNAIVFVISGNSIIIAMSDEEAI